ncbi:MAG TPA: hypothetical protein VN029_02440 [Sphingomonas sp.]|nr:hypothetical protein [Sphingomonas sp.]
MRARVFQAGQVGVLATLGYGIATFAVVREGRIAPAEFAAGALVVFLFTSVAWVTLLTLRERQR